MSHLDLFSAPLASGGSTPKPPQSKEENTVMALPQMPSPPRPRTRELYRSMPRVRLPIEGDSRVLLPLFEDEAYNRAPWKLQPRKSKVAVAAVIEPMAELTDERPASNQKQWKLKPRSRRCGHVTGSKKRSEDNDGGRPRMPQFDANTTADNSDSNSVTTSSSSGSEALEAFETSISVVKKQRVDHPRVVVPLPKKAVPKTFHALSA